MHSDRLKIILKDVKSGKVSIDSAINRLRAMPFKDIEFAKVDTHRSLRRGFPEVIYCEGKKVQEIKKIFRELSNHGENILATRADTKIYKEIKRDYKKAIYNKEAKVILLVQKPINKKGLIIVVTAGTSDMPVAEEACVTAEFMGANVERIYDVGVAGIHRLLAYTEDLYKANAIIVVAGMEGALPSVVGGLVDKPVIAVPTSIGYGASFKGIAPLLTMLNSCASGVTVVNIDNGFGAGCAAGLINRLIVGEGLS